MRKIFFGYSTGLAGMDNYEVVEYDDDVTIEELDQDAWLGAIGNAEAYGVHDANNYDFSEDELDSDDYSYDISGYWEDYDAEKHDRYI